MRMDIDAETKVPIITCIMVCFLSITLDAAINGDAINKYGIREISGNIYIKVKKKTVENVICPLIFQYMLTIVSTQVAAKTLSVTCVSISFLKNVVTMNSKKYPIEAAKK